MSTLTKVFIILVVLASFVYAGISATLYEMRFNWKKEAHRLGEELSQKKSEIEKLNASLREKESELNEVNRAYKEARMNWKKQYDDLQSQISDLKDEREKLMTKCDEIKAAITSLEGQLEKERERNQQLQKEKDDLTNRLTKAQQDLQRWMSEAAEQEMSRIQIARSLTEVQKRYLEALKRVMELEETLEQFKGAGIKIPEVVVAAKPVDGYVLAVSRQPEFNVVILNVGREKGVREGMEFTVYRENQFVGKVRVQSVDNDWSWAISLREFEQMPIRAGDLVSNRLSRYR